MCKLTRRQLFLGGSGLILFGCGDSTTVEQAKDYYPVSQKVGGIDYVLHWGKNNTITLTRMLRVVQKRLSQGFFKVVLTNGLLYCRKLE